MTVCKVEVEGDEFIVSLAAAKPVAMEQLIACIIDSGLSHGCTMQGIVAKVRKAKTHHTGARTVKGPLT